MSQDRPQNLIIFCSDEHARRVARCYGDPVVRTPTLDTIARLGTRFSNAYTPSPIGVPARASLHTGLQVHETRCWSSAEPWHGQHESWAHTLRDAGHPVVSIGELHFRHGGEDHGFDEEIEPMYLASEGGDQVKALLRSPLQPNDHAAERAAEMGPGETSQSEHDRRVAHEAARWLKRYPRKFTRKPWVLFVSFGSPHHPLKCPEEFYRLYERRKLPEPPRQRPEHEVLEEIARSNNLDGHFDDGMREVARRSYYGLVSFLDDNVRQVMEALEESGSARDTSVIYLSDHGEMLGSHGFWSSSVMYEDSVAVPLLMMGRGLPDGAVNATPVSLTDIAATVKQVVGLRQPQARETWMSRPLQGFAERPEPDRFVISQHHGGGSPCGITMLRYRQWKYVHYAGRDCPQLFDVASDRHELTDLGRSRMHERERDMLRTLLGHVLDPETVNAEAAAGRAPAVQTGNQCQ